MSRRSNRKAPEHRRKETPDGLVGLKEQERMRALKLLRLPEIHRNAKLADMPREERRRMQRALDEEQEKYERHMRTTVNNATLVKALQALSEKQLMPLALRLDDAESALDYLFLPFYRRWWRDLRRIWRVELPELGALVTKWVHERLGIRIIADVEADAELGAEADAVLDRMEPVPTDEGRIIK